MWSKKGYCRQVTFVPSLDSVFDVWEDSQQYVSWVYVGLSHCCMPNECVFLHWFVEGI